LHDYLLNKIIEFGESDFHVHRLRLLITREKSHRLRERREYYVIVDLDKDKKTFKRRRRLQFFGMVVRQREVDEVDLPLTLDSDLASCGHLSSP